MYIGGSSDNIEIIILFVVLHICIFCWQLYILRSNCQWLNIYHQSDLRWIGVSLNIVCLRLGEVTGSKFKLRAGAIIGK